MAHLDKDQTIQRPRRLALLYATIQARVDRRDDARPAPVPRCLGVDRHLARQPAPGRASDSAEDVGEVGQVANAFAFEGAGREMVTTTGMGRQLGLVVSLAGQRARPTPTAARQTPGPAGCSARRAAIFRSRTRTALRR